MKKIIQYFTFTVLIFSMHNSYSAIPIDERSALINFYNSTNGKYWKDNSGWLDSIGTECGWVGIECKNDHISRIDLHNNQLNGTIPNTIGQLSNIEYLDLSQNQLTGAIPDTVGNLTNLTTLSLYINQLSGKIPESIGKLNNLNILGLFSNQLSGDLPASLGNLSNLSWLYISYNQLTGIVPSELLNLKKLNAVLLRNNCLTSDNSKIVELLNIDEQWQTTQGQGNNCSAVYDEKNQTLAIQDVAVGNQHYQVILKSSNQNFNIFTLTSIKELVTQQYSQPSQYDQVNASLYIPRVQYSNRYYAALFSNLGNFVLRLEQTIPVP